MKIYTATSWKMKNVVLELAKELRSQEHEVDCFCDDSQGRFIFKWTEIAEEVNKFNAIDFLKDGRTQRAFHEDKKWLNWADICILILPSGKSAHLEAGYAVGQGKKLYIIGEFPKGEFDVMYGFADKLFTWAQLPELYAILQGDS